MVREGTRECPECGGELTHYDSLRRGVRGRRGSRKELYLSRSRCQKCGKIHRELPDTIYPYKQYEAEIIDGVREDLITSSTIGFEDYPCESTMERWRTQNLLTPL